MYFLKIKMKYYIALFVIISVPSALILLILDFMHVVSYMVILGGIFLSIGLLFPLLKYKDFKNKFGGSRKWYFLLVLIIISYTIFSIINRNSQELFGGIISVMIDYTFAIILSIILIILTIHLEYNIMHEEKNKLIDNYSHDLGNIVQSIYSSCELMHKKEISVEKLDDIKKLQKEKLKEASELIKEIRKL
jgi:signal transduction histidine kinase